VATQGRGFWIMDNLAPVQSVAAGMQTAPAAVLFKPEDSYRAGGRLPTFQYWFREKPTAPVEIVVTDASGAQVYTTSAQPGDRPAPAAAGAAPAGRGGRAGGGGGGAAARPWRRFRGRRVCHRLPGHERGDVEPASAGAVHRAPRHHHVGRRRRPGAQAQAGHLHGEGDVGHMVGVPAVHPASGSAPAKATPAQYDEQFKMTTEIGRDHEASV